MENLIKQRKNSNSYLTELEISIIMKMILQAIDHIHSKNIIHRDLKPGKYLFILENILLKNYEDLTTITIVDFGFAA